MSYALADIAKIYAERPNLKKEDVDKVYEWLKTQPHLPELTELQIILFLHGSNYEIETAKILTEKYFVFKSTSVLAACPSEELIRRTLSTVFISVLPKRTPEGYPILLTKLLDNRPQNYDYEDQARVGLLACCWHYYQCGPADGMLAVFDVQGMGLGHLFKISFSTAKEILYFVQEAAPVRVKGIHHVNTVSIVKHLVSLLKPFMKKELYNLMKFHSSLDELYEVVPRKCLPRDYGGELASVEEMREENLQNILTGLEFYKWHDTQKIDESKRVNVSGKNDVSKLEKSVKKLEID